MTKRIMAAASLVAALWGGLGAAGHQILIWAQVQPTNPLVKALLNAVAPVLATVAGLLIAPVRTKVIVWVTGAITGNACRIYLFGQRGSGKTTLIQNVLASGAIPPFQKSTDIYDCFSNDISVDPHGKKHLTIEMADYKGEKPSMVILDLPDEFAGPKGNRKVNVVFFFVDLVPRVLDTVTGEPLDDQGTLEWLKGDTEKKIQQRVEQHREYLSKYTLEIVFSLVYSPRLYSVRLLINKADLVRKACKLGLVPGVDDTAADQYISSLFAGVEMNIGDACKANNIQDFSVHMISAKYDEGTRAMFAQVIDSYNNRSGRA